MKQIAVSLLVAAASAGCAMRTDNSSCMALERQPAGILLPDPSLDAFMAALVQGDYHAIVNSGKDVLVPGKRVLDHASRFAQFPSEPLPNGRIRYALKSIRSTFSVGSVTLALEIASGKVVSFAYMEAGLR